MLGTARNANDLAFQQSSQHTIDRHTANRFNLGPANRLAIRDDGKSLQRRLAEALGLRLIEELVRPDRIFGPGLQLITTGNPLNHEARAIGFELLAQLLDHCLHFIGGDFFVGSRFR